MSPSEFLVFLGAVWMLGQMAPCLGLWPERRRGVRPALRVADDRGVSVVADVISLPSPPVRVWPVAPKGARPGASE